MQAQNGQLLQAVTQALQQDPKYEQIVKHAKVLSVHTVLGLADFRPCSCQSLMLMGVVQAHVVDSEDSVSKLETAILQHLVSTFPAVHTKKIRADGDLNKVAVVRSVPQEVQPTSATQHMQLKNSCSSQPKCSLL